MTVAWNAPPSPVDPVVLETRVYRQYAGPQIIQLEVGPDSVFTEDPADVFTITGSPVVVDVYIAPDDISSMDALNTDATKRGYVRFAVSPYNGATVAEGDVNQVYNNELGHYQFVWDTSATPNGVYKIEATGYSGQKLQGNTVSWGYRVALTAPPAPAWLTATPGDGVVVVQWAGTSIGDFDHYVLERYDDVSGAWAVIAPALATATYTDGPPSQPPLSNGTTYTYRVKVVDTDLNESGYSPEVSATPQSSTDTTNPTDPGAFSATVVPNSRSVNLAWASSTDPGTPSTGVAGYVIQRSADAAFSSFTELESSYPYPNVTYTDANAGWSSTWYYRIAAVDGAGHFSGWAVSAAVTTDAQPTHSLTVNASNRAIYVWVQSVVSGLWYSTSGTSSGTMPAGVYIRNNRQQVWSNLPADLYNVYASTSSTGTPLMTAKSGSGDLLAGDNSISF